MIWLLVLVLIIILVHVILFSWWAYWAVRRRKFWQTPAGVEYNRLRRKEMNNMEPSGYGIKNEAGKTDSDTRIEIKQRRYDQLILCESNLTSTLGVCAEQRKTIDALEIKSSRMLDKLREQEAIIESGRAHDKKRDKAIQYLQDELSKLKQIENINAAVEARLIKENKTLCDKIKLREQRLDDITKNYEKNIGVLGAEISQLRNQSGNGVTWARDIPQEFHTSPTGGQKDIANKPRLDLVPFEFVEGAALAFRFGAKKYSAHNWRKGVEVSLLVRSLLSHVMKYNNGEDKDQESGLHHLDHACATLAMLITTAKTMPKMDNRYNQPSTPRDFPDYGQAAMQETQDNSEGRV